MIEHKMNFIPRLFSPPKDCYYYRMWKVYIIQTDSGQLYTGITNNLQKRLEAHRKARKGGARFFHISAAKEVAFQESHPNRSEASKRESAIKKMSRQEKLALIATAQSI